MIVYTESPEGLRPSQLQGFFRGWESPLSPDQHLRLLQKSSHVVIAIDETTDRVVGFVTAISDGVLAAYVSCVEVLSDYRRQGVGSHLLRRMIESLSGFYMIDLVCDSELEPFYKRFGMKTVTGMALRNRNGPGAAHASELRTRGFPRRTDEVDFEQT